MPLQPPTGRMPFLWKYRPGACLLVRSHYVIFRFLTFQRGGQKLIDLNGAIGAAVGNAQLEHGPIADIYKQNDTDQNGKVADHQLDPASDHLWNSGCGNIPANMLIRTAILV
jgi:hypothetical protein